MERLTEPIKNIQTGEALAYRVPCDVSTLKVWNKLGKYEDLEEQRLLLQLPCKVGDVVYRIGYSLCHRFESYGDSYTCIGCMDECTSERIVCRYIVPNLEWIIENMEALNKLNVNKTIWYLTMEEAEAALKEMEK